MNLIFSFIVVCKDCKFKNLQDAIDFSKNGDTIIVKEGIYMGNFIIKKSIYLKGENAVLDGNKKYDIIKINADNVGIEGFTIINSGFSQTSEVFGIKVDNAQNCTIKNNTFLDNFFSIGLYNVKNCKIESNKIISNARSEGSSGNGIHAWNSENIIILNNYIRGQRDGIYFEFVKNSYIKDNLSERNLRYGLHFMFSNDNTYESNKFIENGAGVAIMYSKNIIMKNNEFKKNYGSSNFGLLLKSLNDSKLENNRFISNNVGIFLDECTRTEFTRNYFKDNIWALRIFASSESNNFYNNKFINNIFDVSTNTLSRLSNLFYHNYWDKYVGYDLNKDGYGDIAYRIALINSFLYERYPITILFYESPLFILLNYLEMLIPTLTPSNLLDRNPILKNDRD